MGGSPEPSAGKRERARDWHWAAAAKCGHGSRIAGGYFSAGAGGQEVRSGSSVRQGERDRN